MFNTNTTEIMTTPQQLGNTNDPFSEFQIGDQVTFGVRFARAGRGTGGIARVQGTVVATGTTMCVRDRNGCEREFRRLKGGWVECGERDDPKGRMYVRQVIG